jgi:V/A-type H+-transporting ATPase subunit K
MLFTLLVSTLLVLSVIILTLYLVKKKANGKNAKTILGLNIAAVFGAIVCITVLAFSQSVFAETVAAGETAKDGLQYLAAALATGLASIGAGIAVAISSSAALGAISEDQKLLGKTLIFVGLSEGIAIYGLIVTILILYG